MIPSHYELNVARGGKHYFNIVFPPELGHEQAKTRAREIRARWAEDVRDLYQFDLTYVICSGQPMEF